MAMRLAQVPHFWAPVTFPMLVDLTDKGEQMQDVSFRAKYKRLTQDEYDELVKRVNFTRQKAREEALKELLPALMGGATASAAPALTNEAGSDASDAQVIESSAVAAEPEVKPITDDEIVKLVLLGWDEVLGDDNQVLPFNPDNLERVKQTFGCRGAIVKHFFDLHAKAAEKNFGRPSVASQPTKA